MNRTIFEWEFGGGGGGGGGGGEGEVELTENEMCFFYFSIHFSETFLILRRI
jgi:hypothetical protein